MKLKPYLDSIELVIDGTGVHFDTAPLSALVDARYSASEREALIDLVELTHRSQPTLQTSDAYSQTNFWNAA